jgi:hypothetical protein
MTFAHANAGETTKPVSRSLSKRVIKLAAGTRKAAATAKCAADGDTGA